MENIHEIRQHMRAIEQTRKITNAMYLISTVHMRKAMSHIDYNRTYLRRIRACFSEILKKAHQIDHPYLEDRGGKRAMYIVIAGDKGMCGSYNTNVVHLAIDNMQKHVGEKYIATVGLVAGRMLRSRGLDPDIEVLGVAQDPSLYNARKIAYEMFDLYDQGLMDEVHIVYTRFKNTFVQSPVCLQLLPIKPEHYVNKIGKSAVLPEDIIYHPNEQELFRELVPQLEIGLVYGALVQAYASEQCARLNAMESSTHNADGMLKKLKLQYNQARQAAITQEITEISSAAEIYV